jgi:hypothetical protein
MLNRKDKLESVILSFEKKKYSRALLDAINAAMKMDMTERPQTITEFMELLEVKAEPSSKIMTFLKNPVLGGGRKN